MSVNKKTKGLKKVDSILALLNILKITTDISEFEKWLKEYHNKTLDKKILEGYKFFLITIFRCLIGQIELNYSLGLKEDFTFFRAKFKGIPIKEIPNTCEKTVFIKNLWKSTRPLRKVQTWNELKNSMNEIRSPLLKLFENIYRNSSLMAEMEKSNALKLITQYYTLIFLNDTSRNIPNGYISVSTIPPTETPEHFERYSKQYFEGYILTLEFLWFKLLGKEMFEKSCIRDLHRAYEKCKEKVMEEIKFESRVFRQNKKFKEEMLKYKEWKALHYFFSEINEKIIKPQEEKIKKNLLFEPLFSIKKINKKAFKEFLGEADEPLYMRKKKNDEIKKWLDYKLLWYDLEVLSSTGRIFSGIPAFLSVLMGLSSISKDKDRVIVKIFKHPEKGVKGFRYSYGVLVPSFGTSGLTDYSGWLIFFNCATDFSGPRGSLYFYANSFIESLKKERKIDVEEIEVEIEIFKEYIEERAATSIFGVIKIESPLGDIIPLLNIHEIEKEKDDFINFTKGILFELIALLWIYENEKFEKIYHHKDFGKGEMDIYCLSKKEKKVFLFECTVAIHRDDIERRIEKIKEKEEILKKRYPKYDIIPVLLVYSKIDFSSKELFEKRRIIVKENFKEKFISWQKSISKDWIKKICRIIEW